MPRYAVVLVVEMHGEIEADSEDQACRQALAEWDKGAFEKTHNQPVVMEAEQIL